MKKRQDRAVDFSEIPPHDTGAELAVLRAVLNSAYADTAPETLDVAAGIVKPDDFYSDANRRIFRALLAIRDAGEPIEVLSLHRRLESAGELEATGGAAYIGEILQEISLPFHAAFYSGIIADKAKLRRAAYVAAGLLAECQAPDATASKVKQLLDAATNELDGCASIRLVGARQWVVDGIAGIETKAEPTIPTGFPALDEKLFGGLRKKNQVVLGARPRVGKTTTAGNLIRNICFRQKIPTIFFSLEMTRQEILKRIVSDVADVYHGKILQPERLCKRDWEQITESSSALYESPFFIDDRCGITLSEILSTIRLGVRKHGVQVVFVDQASLINAELPSQTASKRDEITAVSGRLDHQTFFRYVETIQQRLTYILDDTFDYFTEVSDEPNIDPTIIATIEKEWYFAEMEHVDPLKEAEAAIKLNNARLMSKKEYFARYGQDSEQQAAQMRKEDELFPPPMNPDQPPQITDQRGNDERTNQDR